MNYASRQNELLFYKDDILGVVDAQQRAAGNEVHQMDADRLLNTPVDDLVAYIAAKYAINVPVLHRDRAILDEPQETYIEMNDYGREIRVPATLVTLTVPFEGEGNMFFVRPSTYDTAPPRAVISGSSVVLHVTVRNSEQDRVKATLNRTLDDIERYLGWQRSSVDEHNRNLPGQARQSIDARRERLLRDRNMVSSLGFPVKPRANAPTTYVAPQVRRKIPTLPQAQVAPFKPEPALDEANYKHILDVIDNMTMVMERSPSAFAEMGEEDIRQH